MYTKKYDTLEERFLRYVKFNTRSDDASETIPSTPSQMEFAKMLKKELEELGLSNIFINKACFVNATLPSNMDKKFKQLVLLHTWIQQTLMQKELIHKL